MIYYGGTQNFGGVPKITTGEPKITLGGHPKSGGEPKKGSQISGATPGQVFGKEGIPNLGSPQFGCPSILGAPSHLGPPQIWDPLKFGIPSIWDPSIFGIPYLRRRRKNLAIKLVESFCILSSNHTAILRCRRKFQV